MWKTVWQFLKKLNREFQYESEMPLLGVYPRELKTFINMKTYIQMFTTALFAIAKKFKQPKYPSSDKHVNKLRYIHATGYHLP